MRDIAQAARGKWGGILPALGVDAGCLKNRHGPCPVCKGGTDRFRFDDREGRGTWICNVCGSGDGFRLLMELRGIDFGSCARLVEGIVGGVNAAAAKPAADPARQKEAARRLWRAGKRLVPGDMASLYLAARGLASASPSLRFIDRCRTSRGEFHPAMLALVCDARGEPLTVHRTYLAGGSKAALESPRELMAGRLGDGCAVRLSPPAASLGIAEGVETALAASELFDIPVWAALNAGQVERWTPPSGVEQVTVFADKDANFTGEKAAYALAHRLAGRGFGVTVRVPGQEGDWADVLAGSKTE